MDTVVLYIVGILIVAVGVILSIGLHEIGHLVPAKRFKVHVGQYMIGFGPTLWSKRFGTTEYGIKAIPLGGYISMAGMYPPLAPGKVRSASSGLFQTLVQDARAASAEAIPEGADERAFYRLPIGKRIVIMLGGPTMNLIIAIVLYAIVLCGFGLPQATTTLASVSACVIPATSSRTACAPGDPAAPGAKAGLKPGDRLVSIGGTPITSWSQATSLIRASANKTIDIVVDRRGGTVSLTATPVLNTVYVTDSTGRPVTDSAGTQETKRVGFLSIGPSIATVTQPIGSVLPTVWSNTQSVAGVILNLPQRLVAVANAAFSTAPRDANGPMSLVGVGRIAGEIATATSVNWSERLSYLLQLIASLNVALFVFNLVPLLPLDGGHVAGALWEGIRRSFAKLFGRRDPGPVDTARLVPLTFVVVIVLGAMSALLVYADIVKPITLN